MVHSTASYSMGSNTIATVSPFRHVTTAQINLEWVKSSVQLVSFELTLRISNEFSNATGEWELLGSNFQTSDLLPEQLFYIFKSCSIKPWLPLLKFVRFVFVSTCRNYCSDASWILNCDKQVAVFFTLCMSSYGYNYYNSLSQMAKGDENSDMSAICLCHVSWIEWVASEPSSRDVFLFQVIPSTWLSVSFAGVLIFCYPEANDKQSQCWMRNR